MDVNAYARQRFAQVLAATWRDAAFRALDPPARLLFLWSFTNDVGGPAGLYVVGVRPMVGAITPPPDDPHADVSDADLQLLSDALAQLARKPMLLYDEVTEVLWVVNRARHANTSPRAQALIAREWLACPPSPLRDQFALLYESLLAAVATSSRSVRPSD